MKHTAPKTSWIAATVAKAGNRPDENEDAIAASPETLRFAVTDGATEGWESGKWATHLAAAYIKRPPTPVDFTEWLTAAQESWEAPSRTGSVPWYASIKQDSGSFSTLLGFEFRLASKTPAWTWKAIAIGDSCLFHLRAGHVEAVFPISNSSAFGNDPPLVPSSSTSVCPEPEWLAGRCESDDLFLLATDAVAAFLLRFATAEEWSPVLAALGLGLETKGNTKPLLEWLRTVQSVRNDDLSVVAVRIPAVPEKNS
jgi:hypothetical protein